MERTFDEITIKASIIKNNKFCILQETLEKDSWEIYGILISLFTLAAERMPNGDLSQWTPQEIGESCRWDEPERVFNDLINAGFIYPYGESGIIINWYQNQNVLLKREAIRFKRGIKTENPFLRLNINLKEYKIPFVLSKPLSQTQLFRVELIRIKPKDLLDYYQENRIREDGLFELPKVKIFEGLRLRHTKSRCQEFIRKPRLFSDWKDAIKKAVNEINWNWNWIPNFDWFVKNNYNYIKILEGIYDNHKKAQVSVKKLTNDAKKAMKKGDKFYQSWKKTNPDKIWI